MHYKDSRNDTVKGFDCVHVVSKDDELEIWIGEVKFYKEITSAIRDVVKELYDHTQRDYLRDEFVAITNKIDETWPHSERLRKLLDENISLDDIFDSVAIPVLLTYDSKTINSHEKITEEFEIEFEKEVRENFGKFVEKELPDCINVSLILLPLRSKEDFQKKLHGELQLWN